MAEVQVQEAVLVKPEVEIVYLPPIRVEYPESDGQPVGETDTHITLLFSLLGALRDYFRDEPDVYVAGNLFVYYVEGDPSQVVCPDVFVVKGVPKGERRVYKIWEEGKGPDVVFELTSKKTRYQDLGAKKGIYEVLGVREYFIFDPLGEYLRPPLVAFRLTPEGYRPVREEPLVSQVLGLRLEVEGNSLRLVDLRTGEKLLTPEEAYEARRRAEEELERLRAELERLRKE